MKTDIRGLKITVAPTKEVLLSDSNQVSTSTFSNDERGNQENILCVLWKGGQLGAAYYSIGTGQLYLYHDMIDFQREFELTKCLYHEIAPKYVLSFGNICDPFIKCLIAIQNPDSNVSDSRSTMRCPPTMTLLGLKEYSFESCQHRIFALNFPSQSENSSDTDKNIYIHSLINFENKRSVHALGALIKFLEKNWAHLNANRNKQLQFLHINQISMVERVLIHKDTYDALQIFKARRHDASFKHGCDASNSEGVSVFKLLSQYCKSNVGSWGLKKILLSPTRNLDDLNKRLDFIEFAVSPDNQGFVECLREHLVHMIDVQEILTKIHNFHARNSDWETLYKIINSMICIQEVSRPYCRTLKLLQDLELSFTAELYSLESSIRNCFDFKNPQKFNRPVINFRIDEELDQKKLKRQDLAKHITVAAQFAINHLPIYIKECTITYVPDVGHLLTFEQAAVNLDRKKLQELNMEFMFASHGTLHYKNPLCVELDRHLGDLHNEIIDHENRIIHRLSEFVLKYDRSIRMPLEVIATIDALISVSKVAKERNYIRPQFNEINIHEIVDGRHPLLDAINSNFVQNDFYSGGSHDHLKIITGPNGSGKSVYLKQVALIIYLAHTGCFVPAAHANISIIHSIHSRLHTKQSASLLLSTFMVDLAQMAQAMNNTQSSSLVLIDEFGRGTAGYDGMALLISALKEFEDRGELCPHLLVSTHFQDITKYFPQSNIIGHLKMDHSRDNDENVVPLFKCVEGVSDSFAFDAAATAGLSNDIIIRAKNLFETCVIEPRVDIVSEDFNRPLSAEDIENIIKNCC